MPVSRGSKAQLTPVSLFSFWCWWHAHSLQSSTHHHEPCGRFHPGSSCPRSLFVVPHPHFGCSQLFGCAHVIILALTLTLLVQPNFDHGAILQVIH